jgi:serpin B
MRPISSRCGFALRLGSRRIPAAATFAVLSLLALMLADCRPSTPPKRSANPATPTAQPTHDASPPSPKPPIPPPSVADNIALFSLDLYRGLSSQPGNLILSPASVYLGLAQVMAGARGQTATEFRNALHVTRPDEDFHRAFGELYNNFLGRGVGDYQLKWASRFWVREGFSLTPSFSDLLQTSYRTTAGRFSSPEVADEINHWVSDQTEQQIPTVISSNDIGRDDTLLIVNAIFFHGNWLTEFPESATQPGPFHLLAGESVQTPMMNLTTTCPVGQAEGMSYLSLPYRGDGMTMTILLPDQVDGLSTVEKSLDWGKLKEQLAAASSRRAEIRLPKFKFENTYELTKTLETSLPSVFGEKSDLSGIGDPGPGRYLFVGSIIHVAKVEVEETGTKAAAATVTHVMNGPPSVEPGPIRFIADHPFIFIIHDSRTGLILFMGRVMDPTG